MLLLKKPAAFMLTEHDETARIYIPRYREFGYDWSTGHLPWHQRIVHGVPITPNALLEQLAGASFCVSYAAPEQLPLCMQLLSPQSLLLLDNGAYSIWRSGAGCIERDDYWDWSNHAQQDCPLAVAVIPDVIGGSEQENWQEVAYALRKGYSAFPERIMFIWHMDESIARLRDAARLFNYIGIGSCAEYDIQKHPQRYLKRMELVRLVLEYVEARWQRRPHIHLMRGISMLARLNWADSADSTNIARNHHRYAEEPQHVRNMALALIKKVLSERARWQQDCTQADAQIGLFADNALSGMF